MFKNRSWIIGLLCILGIGSLSCISLQEGDDNQVHWISFDEAVKLNQQHPKKIFIDVYTQWCGWCKKMDAETYTDPAIISYLNKYYYAVRLDAETGDTFHFKGHDFYNPKPHTRGYTNELASSLLDNKLGYPTTVYMNENFERLTYVQSYISASDLMPILKYFAENKYQTMSFTDFKKAEESGSTGK